ncbi:6-bladed beta-propeller [Parabacteroides pacaensis]|uniref:6-bladed beta-propeller n=1 Tax=Parabacteroides pacaensis TaxID=2086575 RepID=UPI000D100023|nr:6-bladed beta-propeller [Parabacteroides pacaensis]
MKHVFYIHLIGLLLCSYPNLSRAADKVQAIRLAIRPERNVLPLSNIASSVKYISLSNDCLLRDIKKLLLDEDNNIYILDNKGNGIFKFDSQGNFIRQISRKGNGPGEYRKIYDFDIDKNQVVLLGETLMYFDLEGKFLHNKQLPTGCNSFSVQNGKIIGSLGAQSVIAYKKDTFEVYKSRTKDQYFSYSHPYHFTKNGNKIFYEDCYNDTIYEVTSKGIKPFFIADFGDLKIPKSLPINDDIFLDPKLRTYCSDVCFFKLSNHYISFIFLHENRGIVCIYNRNSKESHIFGSIRNDIDPIGISMPIPLAIKDKKIYLVTQEGWIYNQYIALKQSEKASDHQLADAIKDSLGREPQEEDNPTLIEVTCK